MQEITTEKLQIAYVGPALKDGRMPMIQLAAGMRGQALLIHRVKDLLYGESLNIQVEVDPEFEAGSLVIPVHILSDGLNAAERLLSGPGVTALANLIQILGFFGIGGVSLYKLFRKLKGRKIERPEDIPIKLDINISIEVLIRIYNDAEVQTQLRKTIHPLRYDGIDEFQTRREGKIIESVQKTDLQAADDAELQDITKDEEVELDIEKAAWRRHLAWHFNNGQTSFDAKIEDDSFWEDIQRGEAFAVGDRLRVHLRTTAHRTRDEVLKIQRIVPKVLGVEHARRKQPALFESEPRDSGTEHE
jgi:hypothetical protein